MTTSLTPSSISVIPSDGKPTSDQFVYFDRRFRNELHGEVLRCFLAEQDGDGLTKAELARRLDKDPAQLTRWLGAPKNWEMETVSRLLLSMGYVPKVTAVKLKDIRRSSNQFHSDDVLEYDKPRSDAGSNSSMLKFDEPITLR